MASTQQTNHIKSLEAAYEKLISGSAVASATDMSGEKVEWTRGNATALKNYIREKKIEYGMVDKSTYRPLRFFR